MAVNTRQGPDGETVTIAITGRFDFGQQAEFRRAYEKDAGPGKSVVIDLSKVDYVDSSALGMMLVLREHMGNDGSKIRIINCRPEIRSILSISNFEKLFTLA
jgi:anti-anti-sigma factor